MPKEPPHTRFRLQLFILPDQGACQRARRSLENLVTSISGVSVELEVIDIAENPQRALDEGIIAVPTLARVAPEPAIKIIGEMMDQERLADEMGLPRPASSGEPG